MVQRVILVLGLLLMLFAGVAMGWQALRGSAPAPDASSAASPDAPAPLARMAGAPPPADAPAAPQNWMITPGGGLVSPGDTAAMLDQGRFTEERDVSLRLVLPVATLLAPGEAAPAPVFAGVFAGVFADVRAPLVALDLCRPLLEAWASGCRVTQARAGEDSYDPATGTAAFRVTLAYTQKPGAVPLPDLGASALYEDHRRAAVSGATPAEALAAAVAEAAATCATVEAAGRPCRLMQIVLDWAAGQGQATIRYGWLADLPQGMFAAPALAAR